MQAALVARAWDDQASTAMWSLRSSRGANAAGLHVFKNIHTLPASFGANKERCDFVCPEREGNRVARGGDGGGGGTARRFGDSQERGAGLLAGPDGKDGDGGGFDGDYGGLAGEVARVGTVEEGDDRDLKFLRETVERRGQAHCASVLIKGIGTLILSALAARNTSAQTINEKFS